MNLKIAAIVLTFVFLIVLYYTYSSTQAQTSVQSGSGSYAAQIQTLKNNLSTGSTPVMTGTKTARILNL